MDSSTETAHALRNRLPLDEGDVLAQLKQLIDGYGHAGIVACLLYADDRPCILAYGESGTQLPLDGDSVFEIGSLSKLFAGTLLADMVLKGEVRPDDPAQHYLPAGVTMPVYDGQQITLLDLATHSAGLPRMPWNMAPADERNPYAEYGEDDLYAFLSNYQLRRPPGTQYAYSNLGFDLLAHLLTLRAEMSYEDLLRRRILDPLGMHDTAITLTPALRSRLALGHDVYGEPTCNWTSPLLVGAGLLKSTARDLLRFLSACRSHNHPLTQTLAMAQEPCRPTSDANCRIGLGWDTLSYYDRRIRWHTGGTEGYTCALCYDADADEGAVVLGNTACSVRDLGLFLLDERYTVTPQPPRQKRTAVSVDQHVLDRYVGTYRFSDHELVITRRENQLWAHASFTYNAPLFAENDTAFFFKRFGVQISFAADADGRWNRVLETVNGAVIEGVRVEE